MGKQGIAKEKEHVDRALGDPAAHLLIAAQRPRQKTVHGQAGLFLDELTCVTRREKFMAPKARLVPRDKFDHDGFLAVMGYQSYAHCVIYFLWKIIGDNLLAFIIRTRATLG